MVFKQIFTTLIYLFAASLAFIMFSGVIAIALVVLVLGSIYWRWRLRRSVNQFNSAFYRSSSMSSEAPSDVNVVEGEFQVIEPLEGVLPEGTKNPKS